MFERVVDNRTLLLGIDKHYRDAMKLFEVKTLMPCADAVASSLDVSGKDVPVEGYYVESPELTKYFLLMRALQDVTDQDASPAKPLPGLRRLFDVTSSPIYGRPQQVRDGELMMLPMGRDPLSQALHDTDPERWSVATLVDAAHGAALEHDDISLVGLAARAKDAVAVAALRESVVLYAEKLDYIGDDEDPEYEYLWRVDEDVQRCANRFIAVFNDLVAEANSQVSIQDLAGTEFEYRAKMPIPRAHPENAAHFYECCLDNEILGRCVNLGQRLDSDEKYHWAIRRSSSADDRYQLEVEDFWDTDLWTTQRYRDRHGIARADSLHYSEWRSKPAEPDAISTANRNAPEGYGAAEAVDTLLELANAYLEMNDPAGAREILGVVLREGNPDQQARARAVLLRTSD